MKTREQWGVVCALSDINGRSEVDGRESALEVRLSVSDSSLALLCGGGQEAGHEQDEDSGPPEEIGRNGGDHGEYTGYTGDKKTLPHL
jgi:hypothetical protein